VGNFTARQTAVINDAVEILRPTGVSYARTTEPRATVFSGYSCVASDAPRKSEYATGPPMRVGIEGTPLSL
jgi:hypothetical protein